MLKVALQIEDVLDILLFVLESLMFPRNVTLWTAIYFNSVDSRACEEK